MGYTLIQEISAELICLATGWPFYQLFSIYLCNAFYNTGLSQSSFTKGSGLRPPQSKPRATGARKNSLTSDPKQSVTAMIT